MPASTTKPKNAEIKVRTKRSVKDEARAIYDHWGITLNDAINIFLVKSIEVGGLPFNVRDESIPLDALHSLAYKAPLDEKGVPVLPAEWDEDDE